jgi:hypothetical protein
VLQFILRAARLSGAAVNILGILLAVVGVIMIPVGATVGILKLARPHY